MILKTKFMNMTRLQPSRTLDVSAIDIGVLAIGSGFEIPGQPTLEQIKSGIGMVFSAF
jgi:hypothetical protein